MTANDILRSTLLDVIFENRNKEYGAYQLRKQYHRRLLLATILSLLVTGISLYFIATLTPGKIQTVRLPQDGVSVTSVLLPAVATSLSPPPVSHARPASSQTDRPFDIVETAEPKGPPLHAEVFFNTGTTGDISDDLPSSQGSTPYATGADVPPVPELPAPPAPPAPQLSSAPSFPGGPEAWASFLQKNLRAPVTGEPGERTTVLVRFVVSEDGLVTGFIVVQSGGTLLDSEVIRVLRKMPRWKPAILNGKRVPAAFTQPVTFQVNEE